jgi:galactose mutarotase-like enzyme
MQADLRQPAEWTLENETLRACFLPAHGGKTTSLFYRPAAFELLFPNPRPCWRKAALGADFSQYEACGFDDAFPGVDAETVQLAGRAVPYPDHGEIWSTPMCALRQGDALVFSCDSALLDYHYEKSVRLEGASILYRYRITHTGQQPFPAIWTCHCLVNSEADMRIVLPEGTRFVRNVFDGGWLGPAGTRLPYPAAAGPRGPLMLDRMPADGQFKYYVDGPVAEGVCGYDYPRSGVGVRMEYDPSLLPYLGFWATAGGYRGDRNCALEPSTGFYDNVSEATRRGRCPVLRPGETLDFSLRLRFFPLAAQKKKEEKEPTCVK